MPFVLILQPIFVVILVFLPRFITFLYMCRNKKDPVRRHIAYIIRMTTTVVWIVCNIGALFTSAVLVSIGDYIGAYFIPTLVSWIFYLIITVSLDLYWSCVYKKYHLRGIQKLKHELDHKVYNLAANDSKMTESNIGDFPK